MTTTWETPHVDQLRTLSVKKPLIQEMTATVLQAIEKPTLPDRAKLLTALAADLMLSVRKRNDHADVDAALAQLRQAIAALEAITSPLDG